MSTPQNYFSLLPEGPEKSFCLSFLPRGVLKLNQRQREYAARLFVHRHIFTGADDKLFTPSGLNILAYWSTRKDDNGGLGPITMCGHLVYAYQALCAALGIYTRWIGAVGPEGPDNQAEYWDEEQHSWVFVNLGCNVVYHSKATGHLLDYITMSQFARKGIEEFDSYSPTGGLALHPAGDKYSRWHLWIDDAVIGNGNAVAIDRPYEWTTWRVWPPKKGKASVHNPNYVTENPPKNLLYPTL